MEYLKSIGTTVAETTTETIKTAGETAVIAGKTVKVGAQTVEVGAKTAKEAVGIAEKVAEAVKEKSGNITKVGLNTSKKALEVASSLTGAVSALSSSIESKVQSLSNNTKRAATIKKQAANKSINTLINAKSKQIKRNANLKNIQENAKYKEKIQKLLNKDRILLGKSLDITLLKLKELKDIVCNKKPYYNPFYKSKCIYIIKNFDLKDYQEKIDNYIEGYKNYYSNLIKSFDNKLNFYIIQQNKITKNDFEQSKLDISTASYEISIFLQLVNYSINNIFSNINEQNISNNQKNELKKIYKMIDNDIKTRLTKNVKITNSLAQIISYQVKNPVILNNQLNNQTYIINSNGKIIENVSNNNKGLRLNNGFNNFERLSNENKEKLMTQLNSKNPKSNILSTLFNIINKNNNKTTSSQKSDNKTTSSQKSSDENTSSQKSNNKKNTLNGLTNENKTELVGLLELKEIQDIMSKNKNIQTKTFEKLYNNKNRPRIKEILNKNPIIKKGYK